MNYIDSQDFGTTTESDHQSIAIDWWSPSGRPDLLYYLPEVSATQNFLVPVDNDDAILCEEELCEMNCTNSCSEKFCQLANIIMNEENLILPKDPMEARNLYLSLIDHIDNL